MKRITIALGLLCGLCACSTPLAQECVEEAELAVSMATASASDAKVQLLAFYPSGKLAAYASSDAGQAMLRLRTGVQYTLMSLVGCPDVSGTGYSSLEAVSGLSLPLAQLQADCPAVALTQVQPFGKEGAAVSAEARHVLSRIRLRSITNAMDEAMGKLEVESVFLANVVAERTLSGSGSGWLNPMGRVLETPLVATHIVDGVQYMAAAPHLTFSAVGRQVAPGATISDVAELYCYPNPETGSTCGFSPNMTARRTRLVVAASTGGLLRYYPIDLYCPEANASMDISLSITNLGSCDPDVPVTTDIMRAAVSMSEWAFGEEININF